DPVSWVEADREPLETGKGAIDHRRNLVTASEHAARVVCQPRSVLALLVLVITVGLVDSVSPATILPALYFALGPHPSRAVGGFVLGFLATNLVAGLVLTLGPGQAALAALPRPEPHTTHLVELAVGALLVAAGVWLWIRRARLTSLFVRAELRVTRASPAAGAAIALIELPTAFPYFGVIAAVVASGRGVSTQAGLVLLFNLIFVTPLLAILILTACGGASSESRIDAVRALLQRAGASLVAGVTFAIGLAVLAIGLVGAGAA
ncbi:MAG: GAP family protein, partial [Gaiellaceae bacterium]